MDDLNVLSVPVIVLEDGDSLNGEDKHQGFWREAAGGGDRMGPWLSLHEEMFLMMTNLKGTSKNRDLGHGETE